MKWQFIVFIVAVVILYGCASGQVAVSTPVFNKPVEIVAKPEPLPIQEGEDWVVATDGASACTAGILMGTGKAARCKWYKVEFEEFYGLYVAEAEARVREHEAVGEFVKSVNEYVGEQEGWLKRNQFWIGLTAGLLIGGIGTAYVTTR